VSDPLHRSSPPRPVPEPDPDPLVLEELVRAFAADPEADAERDRTDAELDVEVDALLAEPSDAPGVTGTTDAGDAGVAPADDADAEAPPAAAASASAPTIVRITDDDLPDAVYLSGDPVARISAALADTTPGGGEAAPASEDVRVKGREARPARPAPGEDPSGDRAVVFIDDDDRGNTVTPDEGRRPTMEPRLRDRRIAVRRAAGRRRLRWVAVAVAVVVLVVGVLAVLGSPLFSIEADRVRVTGVVYTDEARLQAVIDDLVGTPTLVADTQAAEEELEDIAWVDSARVRRRFPRGVTIDIREREPLATYQGTDQLYRVIDRDGRVLDVLEGQPIAYMLLTGPDPVNLAEGEFAPVGYAAAAELVQALTPGVRARVASVDVTADASNLVLRLDDGTEVRFGAANDLLTKLVRLETVLPRAVEQQATVIDVSTAEVTLR
jgi:cell division protein FtsQ